MARGKQSSSGHQQGPSWTHAEVFPIVAQVIADEFWARAQFVPHLEIVKRLLRHREALRLIHRARQKNGTAAGAHKTASNMVAWFSKRITENDSAWANEFNRVRIGGRWAYRPAQSDFPSVPGEIDEQSLYVEGSLKQISINAYERSRTAREECLKHYGSLCVVCGFDFGRTYGDLGEGFIHVHHLVDLAAIGKQYKVNPIRDLRPVCPNCHAILHTTKPAMSIEALKAIVDEAQTKRK